jgi:hypothetical protein
VADPLREAIAEEARHVERQVACSALAQRMAANTWGWILYIVGVPTAALAAVAGASAIADNTTLAAALAIAAAVSSGVATFLNPAGLAGEHRKASTRFRAIENRARVFHEISCAGATPDEELAEKLSALVEEWNRADEESPHVAEVLYGRARRRSERS